MSNDTDKLSSARLSFRGVDSVWQENKNILRLEMYRDSFIQFYRSKNWNNLDYRTE